MAYYNEIFYNPHNSLHLIFYLVLEEALSLKTFHLIPLHIIYITHRIALLISIHFLFFVYLRSYYTLLKKVGFPLFYIRIVVRMVPTGLGFTVPGGADDGRTFTWIIGNMIWQFG